MEAIFAIVVPGTRLLIIPGQSLPHLSAMKFSVDLNGSEFLKRRAPTGGLPNLMPKYSETRGLLLLGCPLYVPDVVLTLCPTAKV